MSMIENWISGYLYNEPFTESNEDLCMTFQSIGWSLVHKNTIKICSPSIFLLVSLSLSILYFLFHKDKDTFGILPLSVEHLMYVFLILFRFYKCFNNFHLNKKYKYVFSLKRVSLEFYLYDARELSISLWSKIISCD